MSPTFRYLWLACKHKWFVLLAGRRTGAKLYDLIVHDWTKFTPAEAPHYGRQFFGAKDDPAGFSAAWVHHQNRNPHHWEHWLTRSHGFGKADPIPMPERYVREMVADWMAASMAYEGRWPDGVSWPWLATSWSKLTLHEDTRRQVEQVMLTTFGAQWQRMLSA